MLRRTSTWKPKGKYPARRRYTRRRGSGFARKKYDVITLFNDLHAWNGLPGDVGCGPLSLSPCGFSTGDCGAPSTNPESPVPGCCHNFALFELVSNSTLESFFQDRVTVVRMFGDLYYQEVLNLPYGLSLCEAPYNPLTAVEIDQYVARYMLQVNWGLRKYKLTMSPTEIPTDDVASPQFVYDSTETPWIWQREKVWRPHERRQTMYDRCGTKLGVRDNTGQAGYTVPPGTSGTIATYNVPAESSPGAQELVDCTEYCQNQRLTIDASAPPFMHWRFNVRKHITLRGDEALHLAAFVRHPAAPGNTIGWNCHPSLLNEGWTGNFYLRIRAVVRLN